MRFVKIRFTAWRDQAESASVSYLHGKPDVSTAREKVLRSAAARVRELQIRAESEVLQMALNDLTTELRNIEAARPQSRKTAVPAKNALRVHKKVGTYGYQILNATGSAVLKIVDASGDELPARAVYTYEIVDDDPRLPLWAKKARIGY